MDELMPGLSHSPNIHPVFVHFPVVLIPTALVFWIVALARRRDDLFRFGRWLLLMGLASTAPTIVTGFIAEDQFGHQELIHVHRNFMLTATGLVVAVVIAELLTRSRWTWPRRWSVTAGLAGATVVLLMGADRGAHMVFGHGIGTELALPKNGSDGDHGHGHPPAKSHEHEPEQQRSPGAQDNGHDHDAGQAPAEADAGEPTPEPSHDARHGDDSATPRAAHGPADASREPSGHLHDGPSQSARSSKAEPAATHVSRDDGHEAHASADAHGGGASRSEAPGTQDVAGGTHHAEPDAARAHAAHEAVPGTDDASRAHGSEAHPEHASPQGDAPHAAHAMPTPSRPLGLPMTRDASGTAWQPDATPMHAIHVMRGDWALMLHGNAFAGWDEQGTERGGGKLTSVNWIMLMATRPVGGGELGLRGMFSAEPWTVGDEGYPLLLQTGETAGGEPLHDRQHPHDLFMEVAVRYLRPVSERLGVDLYAAPAGEPALGPIAFPHRASASSDPLAPLGHHWEDATHISFGVLTAGLFARTWKVEGSWFNGREPDEQREDFDLRSPDSWSARIMMNPTERWSLQVSTGFLESPESLEPEVSVQRTTASVSYAGFGVGERPWTLTAAWGRNEPDVGRSTDAVLVEADVPVGRRGTVFGRAEIVRKTGHDLVLGPALEDEAFDVSSLVVGYVHDFEARRGWVPSIGFRAAVNFMDEELSPFYGDDVGHGGMVYFRIRPGAMDHGAAHQPPAPATLHEHE